MTVDTQKLRARIGQDFDNEATLTGEELLALLDEIERLRGLLMMSLGALEDWPDSYAKAFHAVAIAELQAEFNRLCTPSDEMLQPFREALNAERKGGG